MASPVSPDGRVGIGEFPGGLELSGSDIHGDGPISVIHATTSPAVTLLQGRNTLERFWIEGLESTPAIVVVPGATLVTKQMTVRGLVRHGETLAPWPVPAAIDLGEVAPGDRVGVAFGADLFSRMRTGTVGAGWSTVAGPGRGACGWILGIDFQAPLTPFEVAEGVLRVSSGWLEAEVPVRATCGPITASATSTVDWLGLLEAAIQGGDYDLMEWIRTSAPTSLAVATSSLDAIHRARERVALVAELESSVGDPSLDRVRRQRLSSIWYSAITHGWQPSEGQLETFMRNVMGQREQFRSERQQPAQPIQMETLRVGQLPWAALARGANPTNEELSLALGSYATASETQEVIHVARAWTMARSRDDLVLTAAEDEVGRKAFREWGRRLRADLVRNP